MEHLHFIIYVKDQQRSKEFYKNLLQIEPVLDVPGMTEFEVSYCCKLGIMPEDGISKIISPPLPHPREGTGIPRCEIYLSVKDCSNYYERAIKLGAGIVHPVKKRDWGDTVGYVSDFDGHIIAFAQK
jgi:predicted enzyme related to lactoylglutathione lyase